MGLDTAPGLLTQITIENQEHGSPYRMTVTWSFMMDMERGILSGAPGQMEGSRHPSVTMEKDKSCKHRPDIPCFGSTRSSTNHYLAISATIGRRS